MLAPLLLTLSLGHADTPDAAQALSQTRSDQQLARVGLVVNAAGGAAGFVTLYVGAVGLFGCALDDSCDGLAAPPIYGGGLVGTGLALGVGGGLLHGTALRAGLHLELTAGGRPPAHAIAGLTLHGLALGCLGGSAYFLGTGNDLWDATAAVGLTTGGLLLWITSTALGARQIRLNDRVLAAQAGRVTVRVGPLVDPLSGTIGVAGVW